MAMQAIGYVRVSTEEQARDGVSLEAQRSRIEAWATANGVKADDYTKAYNSFSVNSNLQRAEQLTQRYHVEGVPLIVINGKYTTDVAKAQGQSNLIQLIDDLAASEHKH